LYALKYASILNEALNMTIVKNNFFIMRMPEEPPKSTFCKN